MVKKIVLLNLAILGCFVLNPGCKSDQHDSPKSPQQEAFDEYQNKRLNEFETYITRAGVVPGLEEWQMIAVIMDWNLGQNRYATLSVLRNGRTKIFTSTGAKDIDIKHQNVLNEVLRFLESASRKAVYAKSLNNTKLPEEGHFNFYFKTNGDVSKAEGYLGDLEKGNNEWAELFRQANDVILEVRSTYQDFGNNPE